MKTRIVRPLLFATCLITLISVAQDTATPPTETVVFDHAKVDALLQKPLQGSPNTFGGLLVSGEHYKVLPLRREAKGQVEVHANETDVIYVIAGDATFITGGSLTDAHITAPGETRGSEIEGGVTHQLHDGDIVIVPAGQPHWFQKVSPGFRYLTVKAR
jgi:quercetin dioxygenase-like cupin family protein